MCVCVVVPWDELHEQVFGCDYIGFGIPRYGVYTRPTRLGSVEGEAEVGASTPGLV